MKKIIVILSLFFVFLSFYPTIYEIQQAKNLPRDRSLELVHNYVFDYNFYLSRIREGQEGKWLVTEKYYNKPQLPSLFQIFYLFLGKLGGLGRLGGLGELDPQVIYHAARVILGFVLLVLLGKLVGNLFTGIWQLVAYLFVVTAGSWPILVKLGDFYRFSTHWGGWSVIDSLLRITFIPHVLLGQIFLVLFIGWFSHKSPRLSLDSARDRLRSLRWGAAGLIAGIIFPPVLIAVYAILGVMTILDVILNSFQDPLGSSGPKSGMTKIILGRVIFVIFSIPALLYAQVMFKVEPWKALAVFDIQHRSVLPYWEYALALGPMLSLGILGGLVVLGKLGGLGKIGEKEERLIPFVSWILALGLLFAIFEKVPQQSPTRFTQMLINVPLGILAMYFFQSLWQLCITFKRPSKSVTRWIIGNTITIVILMGLGVMGSMLLWKTDEVRWKQAGTWLYPVGVQLVYPLKDFMDGINYLRLNTKVTDIVLAYEAAGNYIPAYAGNYVYLGHANTPYEDERLKIAARFFSGKMSQEEAKEFLIKENIKYIYFGPQEKEVGGITDLVAVYHFLSSIYTNNRVTVYKFSI